ncbi:MAG: hypothetical protein M3R35_05960 [Candidatus Eremiobacteraeota bacterium]|nr:hypothetical protein [Candidatus Eremiobacteraeota bacterium]
MMQARALLLALLLTGASPRIVPAGDSPILNVQVQQGSVTIRTWNRPEIGIETSSNLAVRHFAADRVALSDGSITFYAQSVNSPNGTLTLPLETFSLAALTGGHDAVDVRSIDAGAVNVQIDVPVHAALVVSRVGRGKLTLLDYHAGFFALSIHTGALVMRNVSGIGYAQVVRGPFLAANSSFDQLRARTAVGNLYFERCKAAEIQVTSIAGSIVYDDGSFEPGLARFESLFGNVALGIGSGSARIGAHSSSGKIFSDFGRHVSVASGTTDAAATVGHNGPFVTATSQSGAVYLYDGSYRRHRTKVGSQWGPMNRVMRHRRAPQPHLRAKTGATPPHPA